MIMMHSTSSTPFDLDLHHYHNQIMSSDQNQDQDQKSLTMKSNCPISWKLYQNPFFIINNNPLKLKHKQLQRKYSATAKFLHQPDLKMSNISSSDNHQQLNLAKTQISELKTELEMERKLRKKMENINKKLSRELADQVCVCDDLTKEVSRLKEEMEKMRVEMEEERKMLRMAEVLREERVQMKLSDAHLYYHQQFLNQFLLQQQQQQQTSAVETKRSPSSSSSSSSEKRCMKNNVSVQKKSTAAAAEAENPHIKQGIKGFVEFQRAIKVKNNGFNSNNSGNCSGSGHYTNKVECQKAQLRVLFKHKCSLPYSQYDHLIIS